MPRKGRLFKCSCCGYEYSRQSTKFNYLRSPVYNGNGHYSTVCIDCVNQLYEKYVDLYYGDENKALERICQLLDLYYDNEAAIASRNESRNMSRMSSYISKLNLTQSSIGKTYADTLIKRWNEEASGKEEKIGAAEDDVSEIDDETVKFFGLGFSGDDYISLKYQYESWINAYGKPVDKVREELYKQLCYQQLQIQKAIQIGDSIASLSNAYRSTLDAANLKIDKEDEQDIQLDPYGKWLSDIEQYSPAEYFSDKKLYDDHDGIKSYIERFLYRPLKNLFTGTKDSDSEYKVQEDKNGGI